MCSGSSENLNYQTSTTSKKINDYVNGKIIYPSITYSFSKGKSLLGKRSNSNI